MRRIQAYSDYKGVPLSRDFNVADGEQVYIGNGQGCNTLWFKNVGEAYAFIDRYEKKIKVSNGGYVSGLIPKKVCHECRGSYSFSSRAWKRRTRENCSDVKKKLKEAAQRKEDDRLLCEELKATEGRPVPDYDPTWLRFK